MPLEQLADLLDIPTECMAEIERGERRLSKVTIEEIARLFEVPEGFLTDEGGGTGEGKELEGEALGRKLRQARMSKGVTLSELSKKAGVSLAHLSEVERGRSSASLKTLEKLAGALGLPISQLLAGGGEDGLGIRIKRLRERIGMTQKELAHKVGISHSLIGQIETERVQPSVGTLNRIAEVLGVSACYFLLEDREERDPWLDTIGDEIKEALKRPVIRNLVSTLAGWTERELQAMTQWVAAMETFRGTCQTPGQLRDDTVDEIIHGLRGCSAEEKNAVLDMVRLLGRRKSSP